MSLLPYLTVAPLAAALASLAALPAQAPQIPADKDPQKTASGVAYSVLVPGKPAAALEVGDEVTVRHHCWLADGKLIDASFDAAKPRAWTIGQSLVVGLDEALRLMTPGARFKIVVPSALAFGKRGSAPEIPPDTDLVYEVEMLSVTPARWTPPPFAMLDRAKRQKTASGIGYEVIEPGAGEPPRFEQYVELEYACWNTTGQLWQSSAQKSVKGPAGNLRIKALSEVVPMMRPGARWRLEVPGVLAFGAQDNSPTLPPNSTTIWDVQIVRLLPLLQVPKFVLPADDALTKTESGLRYQVIEPGSGKAPAVGDKVLVHYAGWLTDGTLFESSFERGEPSEFVVGEGIPGWNEGLQLMKPGATLRFVVPPELGYGRRGLRPLVGAQATLVFLLQRVE